MAGLKYDKQKFCFFFKLNKIQFSFKLGHKYTAQYCGIKIVSSWQNCNQ